MKSRNSLATAALLTVFFLTGILPVNTGPVPQGVSPMLLGEPHGSHQALPTSNFRSPANVLVGAPDAPTVVGRILLRNMAGAGHNPTALARLGDKLYALNTGSNNIAVVQGNQAIRFITVGKQLSAIAADPAHNRLYVSSNGSRSISVIEEDKISRVQIIGEDIRSLLFFENRLLVGLANKATILVLDPLNLQTVAQIHLDGFAITNLTGDPLRHRLYANLTEATAVIDSTTWRVLSTLAVHGSYFTLVASPLDGRVLLSIYDSSSNCQFLVAFDPQSGKELGRVRLGGDPHGAVITAAGDRVYVANSYTNNISVIDLHNLSPVATITVGLSPKDLALDESAQRLYVANADSDSIHIVNTATNSVLKTIPLSLLPTAMASSKANRVAFVANASTDSVYVIQGSQLVKEIAVGPHPIDLSQDEQGNRLFVANAADGSLSIINENNWTVTRTPPLTQPLSTVAFDAPHSHLIAGSIVLDTTTLEPVGRLALRGYSLYGDQPPLLVRVNPNDNRLYTIAWNGVPGSNSRHVVYSVDSATLVQRAILAYSGNTTAFAIDPDTNRLFSAGTHPLAYTNELDVYDSEDVKIHSMPLQARTLGMVYNPLTHHLFLSQATGYQPSAGPTPTPSENVRVLDANTFGLVAVLNVTTPGKMERIDNTIYVTSRDDGSVTMIQDRDTPEPPSPTPTFTPSPWPSSTPVSAKPQTVTPSFRHTATPLGCAFEIAALISERWRAGLSSRLGCPTGDSATARFASQTFDHGIMFYRADDKYILVLFSDKTWTGQNDTWQSPQPDDSCPSIVAGPGLIKPLHGFGKIWCMGTNIRNKIGGATGVEIGLYPAAAQTFENGIAFVGARADQVFVLFKDGTWE